ncbi:AsmA family protein [Methylocystis sp. ATCC 49242]|uniref:AsmA family protein n=1 Tax=Methylocystis sp. ATCC 49242 TaxID=622637 RepID=UPI0001F888C4|nr:AsmA family protein [Methylocystis sp. ATCC 49242]
MSPSAERDQTNVELRRRGRFARALRSGWTRFLAAALAILVGVVAAAAALAPWLFSPTALLDAISGQLQTSSGLYVATRGRTTLSLTPRPHISIQGVAFADRNGALIIEADQLHGVLKLFPLFAGRLEVDSLALVRPRARLDLDQKPIDAPGAAARAAATRPATPEAQKADNVRLGVIAIVDGSLRVRRLGQDYAADRIDASLDWRRIGEAATFTASFDWRGERLQTVLWVARPAMLLRGEQSVATARLDGESVRLEAQGVAQTGLNARFYGHVAGSSPSVRQALGVFGLSAPLPGPFGDAQFSAQAYLGPREAQLKELRLFIDGNEFAGALGLRRDDERLHLTGALKSDFVSLKPMLSDAPALLAPDGQWSREAFDPPDLSGADVDMHIDAAHARLGRLTIDDAALDLTLRDGALDLALTQAQAYRGKIKARAAFRPADGGLSVHASAQTNGVDAGALLWDAFGKQAIGGALDSTVAIDAAGENMATLMRSLSGRATLGLSEGEIAGVDFERALRRLEKRPLASAQDIRSGASPLEKASATIAFEKGVGVIEDGLARGPGFALAFTGAANFSERSLSIKAVAGEADSAGKPRDKGLHIAFELAGGWDELSLTPDPQAFIRRSGAAAPLLPRDEPAPTAEPPAP